jgi:hypothetical protein
LTDPLNPYNGHWKVGQKVKIEVSDRNVYVPMMKPSKDITLFLEKGTEDIYIIGYYSGDSTAYLLNYNESTGG